MTNIEAIETHLLHPGDQFSFSTVTGARYEINVVSEPEPVQDAIYRGFRATRLSEKPVLDYSRWQRKMTPMLNAHIALSGRVAVRSPAILIAHPSDSEFIGIAPVEDLLDNPILHTIGIPAITAISPPEAALLTSE